MTYQTEMKKDKSGWEARTEIVIGIAPVDTMNDTEGTRLLSLVTSKNYNGNLETRATVFNVRAHSRQHAFGLAGGGDFSKKVCAQVGVKGTEKAIRTAHENALQFLDGLIIEAKSYYVAGKNRTA